MCPTTPGRLPRFRSLSEAGAWQSALDALWCTRPRLSSPAKRGRQRTAPARRTMARSPDISCSMVRVMSYREGLSTSNKVRDWVLQLVPTEATRMMGDACIAWVTNAVEGAPLLLASLAAVMRANFRLYSTLYITLAFCLALVKSTVRLLSASLNVKHGVRRAPHIRGCPGRWQ